MPDIYGNLLRAVVFPIGDWLRDVPIGREHQKMMQSQWYTREQLNALAEQKLRKLLQHCYNRMPAFHARMEECGVTPADVCTVTDLAKVPTTDKDFIRRHFASKFDPSMSTCDRFVAHTGGSTGEPLSFYLSHTARATDRASFYRCVEWAGGARGTPFFTVWGALVLAPPLQRWMRSVKERVITRNMVLDAFTMTPERMDVFLKTLRQQKRALLRGYTSALVDLARYAEATQQTLHNLTGIITTAEPLHPWQRQLFERAFGAPVFDQYGCGEVGGVAYECSLHTGLHIAIEHVIVEILDEHDQPCKPGVTGRVVLTALDNHATPFVRYVNGDEAMLLPDSCPCGRGLPLMSAIQGRTSDMIYGVNGNHAHGEFFSHILYESKWTERLVVRQFQVIQVDRDLLRFELAAEKRPDQADIMRVMQRIHDYLGPMRIEFCQVESVDRGQSGKRRFTLRQWQGASAENNNGTF
jgi:phenylacetate-CoA ligase